MNENARMLEHPGASNRKKEHNGVYTVRFFRTHSNRGAAMPVTQTEIKFRPNLPETVQLDRDPDQAKEFESKFEGASNRFRHTCDANQHFFYLPASAHKQLLKTRAEAGDFVRITKSVDGESTMWGVAVLADEHEATQPAPPAPAPGPRMVPQRTSGGNALAAQPAPQAAPPRSGNSHLAQCLCLAVEAAMEASEYARSKGFSVTFLGSDVRAMANTLMIGDQREGR